MSSLLMRQKAPSAKRCIKTRSMVSARYSITSVRKHRAPKGALRQSSHPADVRTPLQCQKAPSAKRCIKTLQTQRRNLLRGTGQKAPSTKRCIKTPRMSVPPSICPIQVRKHRAPKGALRQQRQTKRSGFPGLRQKAPSAKRCIKTLVS